MSSLITDQSLNFSAQLAATIGLEEAIMLQALHDAAQLSGNPCRIDTQRLENKFSFWSIRDIQRICKSLSDKGVIEVLTPPLTQSAFLEFKFDTSPASPKVATKTPSQQQGANRISPYWQPDETVLAQLAQHNIPAQFASQCVAEFVTYWKDRGEISHSWGAKFHKHVIREWQRSKADVHFLQASDSPTNMQQNWQPSADALEILVRNGISRSFIEDAVPEFVLYWRERGAATTTWNSKFIQHVKRQWARFTSALQHDTEPQRIPSNWQPSPEVFEILTLANIDQTFANSCLQEFVLYWKDSNQLHSSWNTKFLQHVKYCWANQDQLLRHKNEGQQNAAGTDTASGFIAKHTDRSWADGL